jgi:hypothetical protein
MPAASLSFVPHPIQCQDSDLPTQAQAQPGITIPSVSTAARDPHSEGDMYQGQASSGFFFSFPLYRPDASLSQVTLRFVCAEIFLSLLGAKLRLIVIGTTISHDSVFCRSSTPSAVSKLWPWKQRIRPRSPHFRAHRRVRRWSKPVRGLHHHTTARQTRHRCVSHLIQRHSRQPRVSISLLQLCLDTLSPGCSCPRLTLQPRIHRRRRTNLTLLCLHHNIRHRQPSKFPTLRRVSGRIQALLHPLSCRGSTRRRMKIDLIHRLPPAATTPTASESHPRQPRR